MRMRNEAEWTGETKEDGSALLDQRGEVPGSVYFSFNGVRIVAPPKNDPLGRRNSVEIHKDVLDHIRAIAPGNVQEKIGKTIFFGETAEEKDKAELEAYASVAMEKEKTIKTLEAQLAERQQYVAELEAKIAAKMGPQGPPPPPPAGVPKQKKGEES